MRWAAVLLAGVVTCASAQTAQPKCGYDPDEDFAAFDPQYRQSKRELRQELVAPNGWLEDGRMLNHHNYDRGGLPPGTGNPPAHPQADGGNEARRPRGTVGEVDAAAGGLKAGVTGPRLTHGMRKGAFERRCPL